MQKITNLTKNDSSDIVGWEENNTLFISSEKKGIAIRAPKDCSFLFVPLSVAKNTTYHYFYEYIDVSNLDVSKTSNFEGMFAEVGREIITSFKLVGIENFEMKNAIDTSYMFYKCGKKSKHVFTENISDWDMKNVTRSWDMFYQFAQEDTNTWTWDLSKWEINSSLRSFPSFNGNPFKIKEPN